MLLPWIRLFLCGEHLQVQAEPPTSLTWLQNIVHVTWKEINSHMSLILQKILPLNVRDTHR